MQPHENSSRKLRIGMILPLRYQPNMLIYPTIKILGHLTNYGHHVSWIIESEEHQQSDSFYMGDIEIHPIPFKSYIPGNSILSKIPNTLINILTKFRPISKVFREGYYDLVLVRHEVRAFDGLIAAYIKWKYKIPLVLELSNPLEHWEEIRLHFPKQRFLLYFVAKTDEFISKRILPKADLVLPISKWLQQDLIENKGIPAARSLPLPEGVDSKDFLNRDGKHITERYNLLGSQVIIYEGEMNHGRGLDILIDAFSKVVKQRPGTKLLMVGNGNDRENLESLALQLGIDQDVVFTGYVLQSEIPDYIAAADIGVSPIPPITFYKFSSPIKVVEYMASAKPVVANEEIPDHNEVLSQSDGGILVSFDPEAFADAIINLLDNPGEAVEMGRKGREWVVQNRDFEVLARQIEEQFLQLVARHGELDK